MDSTQSFTKKFSFPKNERKTEEFQTSDKLKDYEDLCKTFIHFFEEFTGRKVHALKAVENLVYFFDQGFDMDDLIAHVRAQQRAEFYLTNPDRFTIATLFPVKDPDRCNLVWDQLSYYQSLRNRSEKIANAHCFTLRCGHTSDDSYSCLTCIQYGVEYEIMKNPYSAGVPEDRREVAEFFKRQNEEGLTAYARRTFERRKEILFKHDETKITSAHFEMLAGVG